jgi:DNA repair protein SbcC/Rad50
MLTHLKVRNFQGHRNLDIKLDPSVTTIIGPTDTGKSAILRALRWVCFNQPRGDALIRDGASHVSVKLTVDKKVVTRRKGKSNIYKLDDKPFKAFKTAVPEEIVNHLNISDVSFQSALGQHEAPFWFSLTPGQVSQKLNSIVNLQVIDQTLANIASRLRKAKSVAEVTEERLNQAQNELEELSWVPKARKAFARVKQLSDALDSKRLQVENLRAVVEGVLELEDRCQSLRDRVAIGSNLIKAGESYHNTMRPVVELHGIINEVEQIRFVSALQLPSLKPLTIIREKRRSLSEIISLYEEQEQWVQSRRERLSTLEKMLSKVKRCPTCGQRLKAKS